MRSTLQVVTSTRRRGAESFAVGLARAFGDLGRGSSVAALAAAHADGTLDIPVLGARPLGVTTITRLRRRAARGTSILGHGAKTLYACAVAATGLRQPFVYRSIGDPRYWGSTASRRQKLRRFAHRAAAVVALWPEAAKTWVDVYGIPENRVFTIPTGVSADRFPWVDSLARADAKRRLGLTDVQPVMAYVGALSPEKNVVVAIHALTLVPDAILLVAGEGSERAMLEELAHDVVPHRVRFLGSVTDTSKVLAACDVLVLPSLTEGIPGAALEASMSGIPVVATPVGGVAEIVLDGKTGFLVPVGNAAALGERVMDALEQREVLGAAARAHCLAKFEIGIVAAVWDQLLTRLEA